MIRRILLLAFMALALLAAPVAAQDSGYAPTNVTATVQPDRNIRVTGEGCPPGSTGTYELRRGASQGQGPVVDSGEFPVDDNGEFDFIADTDGRPGRYTITVTCGGETFVLGVTVPGGGAALPTTGSDDSLPLARAGVVLVALGGLAVYASRKRQRRSAIA
jgi:LPXTG-motif cell wall-anchored protein